MSICVRDGHHQAKLASHTCLEPSVREQVLSCLTEADGHSVTSEENMRRGITNGNTSCGSLWDTHLAVVAGGFFPPRISLLVQAGNNTLSLEQSGFLFHRWGKAGPPKANRPASIIQPAIEYSGITTTFSQACSTSDLPDLGGCYRLDVCIPPKFLCWNRDPPPSLRWWN